MTTIDPAALAAARLQIEPAQSLAQMLPEGDPLAATLTDAIESAFDHLRAGTPDDAKTGNAIAVGVNGRVEVAVHDDAGTIHRVALTSYQARWLIVQIEVALDAVELI